MKKINKKIDDTFQEKTIENKVVEWIVKRAGGQLTIFKPGSDTERVDLVVKKRGEYLGKSLFLTIEGNQSLENNKLFIKDIEEESFKPEKNLFLIFVYFDIAEQEINDYLWFVPSLEFRDLAESLTLKERKPALRFEAPINPQEATKYTKFLINKKDLAQILVRILSSEKFEFSQIEQWTIRVINLEELKKFIAEARKNTFAGGARAVDNPRLLGSVQLEYQKRDYFYRDIYFGGEKNFIGQEIVYQNNKPIWGMVYWGWAEPKESSDFLKKSLYNLAEKCRFGEECEFEDDNLKYEDRGKGNLERFEGEEKIFIKGEVVYKLRYQGGLISK